MKYILGLLLILSIVCASAVSAAEIAQVFKSKELIEKANSIDGKRVIYIGEAVTAIMDRGEHSWVNLNDGDNAIGIWCKTEALKSVKFLGDYKNKGDILKVEGLFHRACPVHGGELDIHADIVNVASVGNAVYERLSSKRVKAAVVFFAVVLIAVIVLRRRI